MLKRKQEINKEKNLSPQKSSNKPIIVRVKSVNKLNKPQINREKSSNKVEKDNSIIKNNGINKESKDDNKDNSMQLASKNLIENSFTKFANKKLQEKDWEFNKKSNKKTIKNAINNVCLAGNTNFTCRTKILEVMDNCTCENYLILFKDNMGRKVSLNY